MTISNSLLESFATKEEIKEIQKSLNIIMRMQRETINMLLTPSSTSTTHRPNRQDEVQRELTENTREAERLLQRLSRPSSGISSSRSTQEEKRGPRGGDRSRDHSIYITDVVVDKVGNTLMSTWFWILLVAISAVLWEELAPSRFSKLLLRVALYSVALFVYVTYTTGVIKDNDTTSNKIDDADEEEFLIPDLGEIHDCVNANSESKDSIRMENFERETEKSQSQSNSFRRSSIGPFSDIPSSELSTDSVPNAVPEVRSDMDDNTSKNQRGTSSWSCVKDTNADFDENSSIQES